MSIFLNNAAVQLYDAKIKDAFQGKGMLKGMVDIRTGVEAAAYQFVYRSLTEAQQRGAAASVLPFVNPNYTRPTATLDNWVWATPTDIFQQLEVNFDEISSLALIQAMALGRRTDKIIINAAKAASLPADNVIATGGTNLTVEKLTTVLERWDAIGVPYEECTIAISAKGLKSLLRDAQVTNIFYNNAKPLASGNLREYLGMKIVVLPDNTGLPPDGSGFNQSLPHTGTVCTAYAFHKLAIGYAEATIGGRVDYEALLASYISTAAIRAGATAIDASGIVSINYDEAVV